MTRRRVNAWTEYVLAVVQPGERQVDIARRTGIDQTTVSRWLNGEQRSITSTAVAKFARAYERPVLEAFIVAGFITEDEAGVKRSDLIDWTRVTDAEILRELRRRMVVSEDSNSARRGPSRPLRSVD